MARQTTVKGQLGQDKAFSDDHDREKLKMSRKALQVGQIQRAGCKADEIVQLLRANGYQVEVKKLVPGSEAPEAKLELAITYSVEKSLFDRK
jgi:hypothetical protein